MKEATGELNMTVITVVAIAAVGAFFYAFLWPSIRANIQRSTQCSNAVGCGNCDGNTCDCYPVNENGTPATTPIKCPDPNKGKTTTTTTTTNNGGTVNGSIYELIIK